MLICTLANVDLLDATFAACDVNKDDGLTMAEVQTEGCMMTIQNLFGLSNVTGTFLKKIGPDRLQRLVIF